MELGQEEAWVTGNDQAGGGEEDWEKEDKCGKEVVTEGGLGTGSKSTRVVMKTSTKMTKSSGKLN